MHFQSNEFFFYLFKYTINNASIKINFVFFYFRIIIGAPTADTSNIQLNVIRGGAVYRCKSAQDNACQLIPFDSKGILLFCLLNCFSFDKLWSLSNSSFPPRLNLAKWFSPLIYLFQASSITYSIFENFIL